MVFLFQLLMLETLIDASNGFWDDEDCSTEMFAICEYDKIG
jgi:hypothetical protein